MKNHILYSFRRCPYAMRVRWALIKSSLKVEIREVNLKNKPLDLIKKTQNKTVPLLILKNGEIIEESLDIILWALSNSKLFGMKQYFPNSLKEEILNIIKENDHLFKFHLDRFKYAPRFNVRDKDFHFHNAQIIIRNWNLLLMKNHSSNFWLVGENESIADWCIWPFVRQFKIACESENISNYFDDPMISWLNYFEKNNFYKDVMNKYHIWNESSKISYFPSNL